MFIVCFVVFAKVLNCCFVFGLVG